MEAFGAGWWKFIPASEPVMGNFEVLWLYRLVFRDGAEAEAPGHAKYYKNNPNSSYGDALETAKSDAFTRCCKDLGIGLQVWNREYQINWVQTYAMQVPMLAAGKAQWRRKDRPSLPGERVSERQQGPDYVPRETLDQANRAHFDSLKPDPEMPSARRAQSQPPYKVDRDLLASRPPLDTRLRTVSKEEHYYDPDDDEQLRRLHEIEDEVFHSDGREGE